MLAKSMQKHAGRAKEKILQNLGKVDRTADEIFDDHLNNFNRQQASASRLQKEFNNYIRCIRAVQVASKSLMDAVGEIYEPQWTGYDALQAQSAASESLWQDFSHKLADQVLIPLNTYTGQFPEMKKKIEKRNRKLIDYDGQRHSFQSLQANANKRKDDVKLTKGREQLEEARRTYEILNTELHDELPALYDSRILFLVTNLQTLFATENVFHSETAKIYSELEAIVDKLATESQRGSNTLRKQTMNAIKSSSPVQTPVKQLNNASNMNSNYQNQITTNGSSNANSPTTTSSSSQLEFRLDSVSPTPESTPENHKASTPTTPIPVSPARAKPTTTSTTTTATANNNAVAAAAATSINEASIEQNKQEAEENCVNANTTTTTTTKTTIETVTNDLDDTTKTTTTAVTTNDMQAESAATTTTTTIAERNSNDDVKTEIATELQNGNTANGNFLKSEQAAVIAKSTVDAAPANEANNGNVEEHKKSLGGKNIYPTLETSTNDNLIDKPPLLQKKNSPKKTDLHKTVTNNNTTIVKSRKLESKNPFEDDERIYEVPTDATTADLPPGVLYRVKATYGYVKEDVDELSFEIGDIIRVIEYDDPEDQEEGWLMGQKEGTTEKGLFPANFTRPI